MRAAIGVVLAALALPAAAVTGATMDRPLCDPCVPDTVKKAARVAAPSQGEALRAEIEASLRRPFAAAAPSGRMTREQARAAGLGFIERNFEAIDREGRGAITFDDYRRYLEARRASAR